MGENACNGMHDPPFSYLFSPLKQFNMGIPYSEITYVDDLVLVQKYENSPACVTSKSIPKLIERGWIKKSNPEFSGHILEDTTKDIQVPPTNNNAVDSSVDEKGILDLFLYLKDLQL